jgi:hypothetical protein
MKPEDKPEWEDATDEWTDAINAEFPTRSGSHHEYGVAMKMVGNRHGKGELVALVNWLLVLNKRGAAVDSGRLTDALERIRELEDLICESAPLSWASWGFPDGTEAAQAWEKRAKASLDRYPDALGRMGMVRG